eukprot:TRINITY_DN79268_c0_g1_i1.p1 TRINITY_DN79268_c0_g1~~TRINITY_DN79268_c0_g1_i1.p1  ORF type:complete len:326 (-),score=77.84 TRINITY_DN79268_c0_g1_i1:23-970(-)
MSKGKGASWDGGWGDDWTPPPAMKAAAAAMAATLWNAWGGSGDDWGGASDWGNGSSGNSSDWGIAQSQPAVPMYQTEEDEWRQNRARGSNPYDFDAKGCNLSSSRDFAAKLMEERGSGSSQRGGKKSRSRSRSKSKKKKAKKTKKRKKSTSSSSSSSSSKSKEKESAKDSELEEKQRIEKIANAARVNRIKKRREAARSAAGAGAAEPNAAQAESQGDAGNHASVLDLDEDESARSAVGASESEASKSQIAFKAACFVWTRTSLPEVEVTQARHRTSLKQNLKRRSRRSQLSLTWTMIDMFACRHHSQEIGRAHV